MNQQKAMVRDLAGYPLTIIVVLAINKRAMLNEELCAWCGLTDKSMARHLDLLDDKGIIFRTRNGWMLDFSEKQLSFLNGIGVLEVQESGDIPRVGIKLSTAPTTTTKIDKSIIINESLLPARAESEILRLEEKTVETLTLEEEQDIKAELVRAYLGDLPQYQYFVTDKKYSPEFIFGHYLALMSSDQQGNRALFVEHLLNRPVHPDFLKQARKMIMSGDY